MTTQADRKGLHYAPMAFTEQSVVMLSSLQSSLRAAQVNSRERRRAPAGLRQQSEIGNRKTSLLPPLPPLKYREEILRK